VNPHKSLLAAAIVCLGLVTSATARSTRLSPPEPLSDGVYAITNSATNAFNRDLDALRAGAVAAAKAYCESQDKVMKLISVVADKPRFSLGYYSVKVLFKPLQRDDPELTAPPPSPVGSPASAAPSTAVVSNSPTGTGDYYNDLLKLDDLHKRGIITEKEFEKQKKKLLKDWK